MTILVFFLIEIYINSVIKIDEVYCCEAILYKKLFNGSTKVLIGQKFLGINVGKYQFIKIIFIFEDIFTIFERHF